MTLTVTAYRFDEKRARARIQLASDLAGVESSRGSFYGSPRAVQLGLELLPRLLSQAELWVSGAELQRLALEVDVLLKDITDTPKEEYWSPRLANILKAIDEADRAAGCVCIG